MVDYLIEDNELQNYFQSVRRLSHAEAIEVIAFFIANSIQGSENPEKVQKVFDNMVAGARVIVANHSRPEVD